MFKGRSSVSLDSKGRFVVPARVRELLASHGDGPLTITADPNRRCLRLYTAPEWAKLEARVAALSDLDDDEHAQRQFFLGYAVDYELDTAGRVLLTPALRKFAQLDKELAVVGVGQYFEIWDDARLDARLEDDFSQREAIRQRKRDAAAASDLSGFKS